MHFFRIIRLCFSIAGIQFLIFFSLNTYAQQSSSTGAQKPPQGDINAVMEKAMQNMTPAQKEQMQKLMATAMPAMQADGVRARYPDFTNNKELLYKKDPARINAARSKKLQQQDISSYAGNLYNKIISKGDPAETAIVKSVMTKGSDADFLGNAAITAMLQGHAQAAMALSMKAVQADPVNATWQNNMASLLTQYGYAENAVPVLQKLRTESPSNTTVLNNIAQAWFSLGETDSAYSLVRQVISNDPLDPEALVCGGIIKEAKGDIEKATEDYQNAMTSSPNPFTEQLLRNRGGQASINNIDFDKLKNNITIYAYFPKDWIQIPTLTDNVAGFENDAAVKNGYAKMFFAFHEKLKNVSDLSQGEMKKALSVGKDAFATSMMQESAQYGTSFISNPARIIVSLLTYKIANLSMQYAKEKQKLDSLIKEKVRIKIEKDKDDECHTADIRNNQFLQEVNPMLRKFFSKYTEEYRTWLNAFCTWTWFMTGNIKNFSMIQCLGFTRFYSNMYKDAVEAQKTAMPHCSERNNGNREENVAAPDIPSFACPTVVSIPAGMDWYALDNSLKNFDANSLGIKQLPGAPIPNMSIAFEPKGMGQTPSVKTVNGGILPEYGLPRTKDNPAGMSEEDIARPMNKDKEMFQAAVDLRLSKILAKLNQRRLQAMMLSDCDELKSMKESDKQKAWDEKKRKADEQLRRDEEFKKWEEMLKSEEFKEWDANQKKWAEDLQRRYDEAFQKAKEWYGRKRPAPVLKSSPQAPGTFTSLKNLFQ